MKYCVIYDLIIIVIAVVKFGVIKLNDINSKRFCHFYGLIVKITVTCVTVTKARVKWFNFGFLSKGDRHLRGSSTESIKKLSTEPFYTNHGKLYDLTLSLNSLPWKHLKRKRNGFGIERVNRTNFEVKDDDDDYDNHDIPIKDKD